MRIGLISDTHIPGGATEVPAAVVKAFEGVELILHAGNIYTTPTLDWLEQIAPIKVAGSVDRDRQCHGDPRVEEKQVLDVEGVSIGVIHDLMVPGYGGWIYPGSVAPVYESNPSRPIVPEEFFGRLMDIVIFGHTCVPMVEQYGSTMLVNPGSPTLRNQLMKIGHVAILDVTSAGPEVTVIDLAEGAG